MWRLGWLIVNIKNASKENNDPIFLQSLKAFDNLFDAFGGWIYNKEKHIHIIQSFQEFEKIFGEEFNSSYDEIMEEAKKTLDNIGKFLQKFK